MSRGESKCKIKRKIGNNSVSCGIEVLQNDNNPYLSSFW